MSSAAQRAELQSQIWKIANEYWAPFFIVLSVKIFLATWRVEMKV